MSDTMDRVVEVLEDNKQLAIGLVIDEDQKLVGTVTDGDIREGGVDGSVLGLETQGGPQDEVRGACPNEVHVAQGVGSRVQGQRRGHRV